MRDLVGKAVLVRQAPRFLMMSDKILRIVPDGDRLKSAYLEIFLGSNNSRRQIEALLSGSSGQNNISQRFIRSMVMGVPPIDRQETVASLVEAIVDRISAEEAHRSGLRALKQGLMDDLLTGRVRVKDSERVVETL
ncbi:hypothetical protein AB0M44_42705 [Streptosporangium subroseum]|uniref:hypothetical protein n=1 Tax=Streptosporangium subroseum TaxID=106412 RepID=UPI00343CFC8D